MPLGRLLRVFLEPAPDPRRTERAAGNLHPQVLAGVQDALATIAESRDQLAARIIKIGRAHV